MIPVLVNGDERSLDDGSTVAALAAELECGERGVAIAVNREVVPRSTWTDRLLHEGDVVEVLNAVQGGC